MLSFLATFLLLMYEIGLVMMTFLGSLLLVWLRAHVEFWSVTAGRDEKPKVGEAHSGGARGAGKADKTVSVETTGWLLLGFLEQTKDLSLSSKCGKLQRL